MLRFYPRLLCLFLGSANVGAGVSDPLMAIKSIVA